MLTVLFMPCSLDSGETGPLCKVTPVILPGVASPDPVILHGVVSQDPVILHGVVSPEGPHGVTSGPLS